MRPYVITASKDGHTREAEADTLAEAQIVAETWHRFLWRQIAINGEAWQAPKIPT